MPRNILKRSLSESPQRSPSPSPPSTIAPSTPSRKRPRLEPTTPTTSLQPSIPTTPLSASAKRKLRILSTSLGCSPFPLYSRPTPADAQHVYDLLVSAHGSPHRHPLRTLGADGKPTRGLPSILDSVVRSILSQSTSSANSTAAKEAMDLEYGHGDYRAVLEGGEARLRRVIEKGGLGNKKAAAIMGMLGGMDERLGGTGRLSLNHLHDMNDPSAMEELCKIDMLGIKSAACVLQFSMRRDILAVDTHVHRLCIRLGWVPLTATADETFFHLHALISPHLKYALHSLLVSHGRGCTRCSSNGIATMDLVDKCPLVDLFKSTRRSNGAQSTDARRAMEKETGLGKQEKLERHGAGSVGDKADPQ